MQWTVLIPAKSLPAAKSRLAPRAADAAGHARLVEAIRADTVSAALTTSGVARVVLVVDRPGEPGETVPAGVQVVVQRRPGLNAALAGAAVDARERWPDDGVAALLGDLPALRPAELDEALRKAAAVDAGYVCDADGTGTTLLTAAPGITLAPQFGTGSAQRHATGAQLIGRPDPGLRRDVDTAEDLQAAAEIGLGEATRRELASPAAVPSSSANGIVSL